MKSKQQKAKEMEKSKELLGNAKSLVFINFSKTPTKEIGVLKEKLSESKGSYKIIKKRLLGLVLKEKNIPVDVSQFDSQLATVFGGGDISESAGTVWKFFKEREKDLPEFKMLGGYDFLSSTYFASDDVKRIGQLPSREILLAQLLGTLQAPLKSLAYTLSEIAKKK
ncbi:MAG: 50S ribosomal protein L10 [Candidatus Paceibacterota bacterium]|jgi:large subunit ribosomal protein L10